ncbi:unnamed protein product [Bursaphelenchus okinawaensis]|uniref:RanBP2-type domain-containing protein n=1 Tax=Bursaphelenchus okinawaensis TaxID=465554 RepID=A0A811LLN9_9BILA|nr:unnamed protein product [Bursaphelenchus okinawaensis]CAG9126569.1 unnamed protein product [Bursaphelenchus okinawaensis]
MSSKRTTRRQSEFEEEASKAEAMRRKKESRPSTSRDSVDEDDEIGWECSVCTYRNKTESFKCEICEARKGTSTRKPRLNNSVVQQQQTLVQNLSAPQGPIVKRTRFSDGKSRFSPESTGSGTNSRGLSTRSSPIPVRSHKKRQNKKVLKLLIPFSDDLVDREVFTQRSITTGGLTCQIVEFKLKEKPSKKKKREKKKSKKDDDDS